MDRFFFRAYIISKICVNQIDCTHFIASGTAKLPESIDEITVLYDLDIN